MGHQDEARAYNQATAKRRYWILLLLRHATRVGPRSPPLDHPSHSHLSVSASVAMACTQQRTPRTERRTRRPRHRGPSRAPHTDCDQTNPGKCTREEIGGRAGEREGESEKESVRGSVGGVQTHGQGSVPRLQAATKLGFLQGKKPS